MEVKCLSFEVNGPQLKWVPNSYYKEHPGLIFIMDWLDLLAVQGVLKTLLQHHSSKASILEMEREPEVPASTQDEALFHCHKTSGVPRGPSQIHSTLPLATRMET